MTLEGLRPGDVLLYKPVGLYGWLIRLKTWHPVAHVEVFRGDGMAMASRNKIGVGRYPVRLTELVYVLRPNQPLDLAAADRWFATVIGAPYGWGDLAAFLGLNLDVRGMVCSPFATDYLRAATMRIFNYEPSRFIAPFQFLLDPAFDCVYDAHKKG